MKVEDIEYLISFLLLSPFFAVLSYIFNSLRYFTIAYIIVFIFIIVVVNMPDKVKKRRSKSRR